MGDINIHVIFCDSNGEISKFLMIQSINGKQF